MAAFAAELRSLLNAEFDRWADTGRKARLWLRDDDASQPGPQLERLLEISETRDIPLLLATIPMRADLALKQRILETRHSLCAVHGAWHRNHAPKGEKSQELGRHRPLAAVIDELRQATQRLHGLMGSRMTSILVPPWNRIAPEVAAALPDLGFQALSTFGKADEARNIAGLAQLNTHLDIIDWRGTRGGRDPDWLVRELVRLLAEERSKAVPQAIGILTHHAVHDETAWGFLDALVNTCQDHPAVAWADPRDLIGCAPLNGAG